MLTLSVVSTGAETVPHEQVQSVPGIVLDDFNNDADESISEAQGLISLYWAGLESVKPSISVSNGTENAIVSVSGYTNCTKLKITLTIQKRNLLFWWDDVVSWTETFNVSSKNWQKIYDVGSGTFRVQARVIVYNRAGTVLDDVILTS